MARQRDEQGMPRWQRWALEGAALGAVPGFVRGLGPRTPGAEMAAHDVLSPYAPEIGAMKKAVSPSLSLINPWSRAGILNTWAGKGKDIVAASKNMPWKNVATGLYEQTVHGPVPGGLLGRVGFGFGRLAKNAVQYGPRMALSVGADLMRGAAHDFQVPGAKPGNSLLINAARAAVVLKMLAPIPAAIQAAHMGPMTDLGENPMLTRKANAANAHRRLQESVAGLTLNLHELRGATIPI